MSIVSAHHQFAFAALPGGVSSEIYRVDLPGRIPLRQACPGQAQGRRRLACSGRKESLGGRVDARRWRHRAHRGPGDPGRGSRGRMFRDGLPSARDVIPSGRTSRAPAPSTPRRRRRSATCSAGFTPRRQTAPTSPRASRPTTLFHALRLEPYLDHDGACASRSRAASSMLSSRRRETRSACWSTATSARRTC